MGNIAYIDCYAGVSGDMLLGAITDAGIRLKDIKQGLDGLPVKGYVIKEEKVKRSFLQATKVTVQIKKDKALRRWRDIEQIINKADLPQKIKEKGLNIFKSLFKAEGVVHGLPYNEVHLHEIGAIDCLVDIFGTLIGFHLLGIDKVFSTPVNLGSGTISTEHGIMPVPTPAVIEILKDSPVYSSGPVYELTTPTGAAIIREVVDEFRKMPLMNLISTGYGAGSNDFDSFPNVLRIIVGKAQEAHETIMEDNIDGVTVIETNIDDMNPQVYEYLFERLFEAGAIDVFLTQVIMKKGRPGILLSILCDEKKRDEIAEILFRETTTLGLRFYKTSRMVLEREIRDGHYNGNRIKVKVSRFNDYEKANPEYEDCKRLAKQKGIPLIDIMKGIRANE